MGFIIGLLTLAMVLLCGVLILLVLIQRGKGGCWAGAFGGLGGSSAFGSRAGDLFTRITIVVFGVWLVIAMVQVYLMQQVVEESKGENATVLDVTGSR